jgi:hypothetical protein
VRATSVQRAALLLGCPPPHHGCLGYLAHYHRSRLSWRRSSCCRRSFGKIGRDWRPILPPSGSSRPTWRRSLRCAWPASSGGAHLWLLVQR